MPARLRVRRMDDFSFEVDSDGRPHVLFAGRSDAGQGIIHAQQGGGRWHEALIADGAAYANIASTLDGQELAVVWARSPWSDSAGLWSYGPVAALDPVAQAADVALDDLLLRAPALDCQPFTEQGDNDPSATVLWRPCGVLLRAVASGSWRPSVSRATGRWSGTGTGVSGRSGRNPRCAMAPAPMVDTVERAGSTGICCATCRRPPDRRGCAGPTSARPHTACSTRRVSASGVSTRHGLGWSTPSARSRRPATDANHARHGAPVLQVPLKTCQPALAKAPQIDRFLAEDLIIDPQQGRIPASTGPGERRHDVHVRRTTPAAMATIVVATHLLGGLVPAAAAEEAHYCVTVRSDGPIGDDWLAAVLAGEATIVVEDAAACIVPAPTPAVSDASVGGTTAGLLLTLRIEPETPAGYDRDLFRHWIDADGDGCDTRDEVLITESLTPVSVGAGCRISDGSWHSAFDGVETTDASDFDIDHVVPLAEAWRSGAAEWDDEQREAYANDLGDDRVLRAVSARSNRSKSDQDPSEWLPPEEGFHCQYVSDWVAIKVRWDLAADPPELAAIEDVLADCPLDDVVVPISVMPTSTSDAAMAADAGRSEDAEPTSTPPTKKPKPPGDCDPSYPGVCIKPPPPDLDCGDIPERRFKVKGQDPHHFDGDGDGIGCES